MTEVDEHTHQADVSPSPVPVHIGHHVDVSVGHDVDVQGQAADFGSWFTYTTPAGADTARQRHRAVIVVSAPGAIVAGSGVWVGTQAQTQATPSLGGFLPAGTYVIENNQPLWMIGDGANSMRVAVLQERWDNSPGHPTE